MGFRETVLHSSLRWFVLASLVGLVAGLAAIVFFTLSHELFGLVMGDLAGYRPEAPRGESGDHTSVLDFSAATIEPWACLLIPAVGGLLVGLLVTRFAPEARGHGTDGAIFAFHQKRGVIHTPVIWVKTLASAITLGTGGSGGREGPIAQIGAGFGSWLGTRLGLSARERRMLLAIGMGAGVAAIFRAPLAGALFAAEVLYARTDFESEVVMPSIIACVISYTVFTVPFGQGTLFATDLIPNAAHMTFKSSLELVPYTVLGLVMVLLVHLYVKVFYGTEALFERLRAPAFVKPAIGGLLTGGVALLLFGAFGDGRLLNVLGFGYSGLQEAFDYSVPAGGPGASIPWALVGVFVLIALGKMVTTSLTIGSGGSAGIFGPSMVIGGAAGTAVGLVFHHLWPDAAPHPGAFTIVGMAGFFTGAAHTPISTLIMVSEVTGNYHLLLPAMWVEAISFAGCRGISMYKAQVYSRVDSPAHRGDFIVDILEDEKVEDVMDRVRQPTTIPHQTRLRDVIKIMNESRSHYFPVTDESGAMMGIFSTNDVRRYLHDEPMWDLLVVEDVMTRDVLRVTAETDLNTVLRRFTQKNIDELPVVAVDDETRVLGMLRRREVIAAYNTRMAQVAEERKAEE